MHKQYFAHRSPVITLRQSAAIVDAMQALDLFDNKGYLNVEPRMVVSRLVAGYQVDLWWLWCCPPLLLRPSGRFWCALRFRFRGDSAA